MKTRVVVFRIFQMCPDFGSTDSSPKRNAERPIHRHQSPKKLNKRKTQNPQTAAPQTNTIRKINRQQSPNKRKAQNPQTAAPPKPNKRKTQNPQTAVPKQMQNAESPDSSPQTNARHRIHRQQSPPQRNE